MLTKEELENIKVGDIVVFDEWQPNKNNKFAMVETSGEVMITRTRCGEQGDIFEDYVVLTDHNEVNYKDIKGVIKQ